MNKTFFFVLVVLLASSCASVGDPFTLAFGIPEKDRAAALASAGADVYRTGVLVDNDMDALKRAHRYLQAALRYDPANQEAARFLALVDDYRANRLEASLTKAQDLAKKQTRNPEEDYQLHVSIRRAATLDPKNEDARRLLKDTEAARAILVKAYLDKSTAAQAALAPETPEPAREKTYIDAFTLVSRATEIEPSHFNAQQAYRELKRDIEEIMRKRIEKLTPLYKDGTFGEARTQIGLLRELDARLGRIFRDRLNDAEYSLYYAWALSNEKKKDWNAAEARALQAQSIKRGSEAAELAKRVAEARLAEERGAGFAAGLKRLDALIAKGDLNNAQRSITSLSKIAAEGAQQRQVDDRRRAMRGALESVYAAGVKAYREERFKDAMSSLRTVVDIDPGYQDAADYLDKAQAKQKLIEQY